MAAGLMAAGLMAAGATNGLLLADVTADSKAAQTTAGPKVAAPGAHEATTAGPSWPRGPQRRIAQRAQIGAQRDLLSVLRDLLRVLPDLLRVLPDLPSVLPDLPSVLRAGQTPCLARLSA
jgi:hypothetical protein